MMAIVDVLEELPAAHPRRDAVIAALGDVAEAVAKVQDADSGLWWQILDQGSRAGNYLEASASSMFVYAIAKGVRMSVLDGALLQVAQRGHAGLVERLVEVDETGIVTLNGVCAVAGLGGTPYRDGSYAYYVGEPRQPNDYKGAGPFILASLEIESVANNAAEQREGTWALQV